MAVGESRPRVLFAGRRGAGSVFFTSAARTRSFFCPSLSPLLLSVTLNGAS